MSKHSGDKKEVKFKGAMNVENVAGYLEDLARSLRDGQVCLNTGEDHVVLVPAGVMKVEIEAEEKKGKRKFSLELSWLEIMPEQEVTEAVTISSQAPEPVEEAGEGSEGEVGKEVPTGDKAYKRLKKEMKKTWETIVEAVERGQMPELPLVEEFYNQSKEMTTFPGKGDEYYQQYSAAADDLFAAAELEDMTNFSECVKTMEQLKKDCHDRYK